MEYPAINIETKSGREELTINETPTQYKLLDFWKWTCSDIILNKTRGAFAEFIVATAVGFDGCPIQKDWDPYDLTADNGNIKIEVKSAAYIQSWEQKKLSDIIFSIRAPKSTNIRPSDVYVFCLLKHKDQNTINPLKLEQWEFYVVNTLKINNYNRSKTNITLNSLKELAEPVSYDMLEKEIYREAKI